MQGLAYSINNTNEFSLLQKTINKHIAE